MLEATNVVQQRYRRQSWLRHFWVRCDGCEAHKLYWPTARQVRLASQLRCRIVVDDSASDDVTASYARTRGLTVIGWPAPVTIPTTELPFLLSMLAAMGAPGPANRPTQSYLPAHWAN
jgi:hypothetical protein